MEPPDFSSFWHFGQFSENSSFWNPSRIFKNFFVIMAGNRHSIRQGQLAHELLILSERLFPDSEGVSLNITNVARFVKPVIKSDLRDIIPVNGHLNAVNAARLSFQSQAWILIWIHIDYQNIDHSLVTSVRKNSYQLQRSRHIWYVTKLSDPSFVSDVEILSNLNMLWIGIQESRIKKIKPVNIVENYLEQKIN